MIHVVLRIDGVDLLQMNIECAGAFVELLAYFTNKRPIMSPSLLLLMRVGAHMVFQVRIGNEALFALRTNVWLVVFVNSHVSLEISPFSE